MIVARKVIVVMPLYQVVTAHARARKPFRIFVIAMKEIGAVGCPVEGCRSRTTPCNDRELGLLTPGGTEKVDVR